MKGRSLSVASGLLALAWMGTAKAALTSSEKGQIASYLGEARAATAERVRGLIARPDLTADESADALGAPLSLLVFQDARAAYLHEMLYGTASAPSRSVVTVAIARGLVARADALLARHEADLDQDAAAITELTRIFAFLDDEVANAGDPVGAAHDASAGIGASSYDDAERALAALITKHPRWLKGDAPIPAAAAPVRAQLQLAVLDMASDTTGRRIDVADRLGLTGSRRAALTETGLLLLDDGHTDAAQIDRARSALARLGGARAVIEGLAFFVPKVPLQARGEILVRPAPAPSAGAPMLLFGDDVAAPPVDGEQVALAHAIAEVVARRALAHRPDLRAQVERDAAGVKGDPHRALGPPTDGSAIHVLASALELLELDGPTTIDLALARLLAGYAEPTALLSDALGALADFAPSTAGAPSITLGRARDPNGTIAATAVHLAPAGFVTGFTLSGHTFAFGRDDTTGMSARRDGNPVVLSMLESARVPVSVAPVWSGGGLVFAKLSGTPRAGVATGGRVRLMGDGKSVDAIATAAPGNDAVVDATVEPAGEVAFVVRATSTPAGFKGVALVIDSSATPWRASIRAWDDTGKLTELAPPVDVTPAPKLPVHLVVKGMKLEARAGSTTLHADVPAGLATGDLALATRHGSSLEVGGWAAKRP